MDDVLLAMFRHDGHLGRSAGVVERTVALAAVGDAVLQNGEHIGRVIGAEAVAGAEILIDPDPEDQRSVRIRASVHPGRVGSRVRHCARRYAPTVSSSFGQLFRLTTFGESHGPAVGVVLDGCPPRLAITEADVQRDLDRRRPGQSRLVTQRDEADQVEFLSGVFEGRTTGTAFAMMVRNADHQPGAYDHLRDVYRPSHADWTYRAKYGIRDHRGGGRASARETIGRVAAGAIARRLLAELAGIEVLAWVSSVHDIDLEVDPDTVSFDAVEADPTRCPHPATAARMTTAIENARRAGDSLGGVVTFVARNVPAGLGEPVFDKIDADLAKAMISLPAAKGFEVGSGFAGTRQTGLQHNDPFEPGPGGAPILTTNNSGGIQGGITTGADLVGRVAFKPTATISSEQKTVNTDGDPVVLAAKGRHDPCVLPRAVPLVEAMALLVLADHLLRQRTVDVLPH